MQDSGSTVWVCVVCGYEHVGDNPPDVCPVCGADADQFEKKRISESAAEDKAKPEELKPDQAQAQEQADTGLIDSLTHKKDDPAKP